jgi:alpha-D-ribose 1-methylphosphonate 5-triphosphate synthase subunit PhnG
MIPMTPDEGHTERAAWMRILSLAPWGDLEPLAKDFAGVPHDMLRKPEGGLVMLRGRMGSSGAAFNVGEATVTRCAVRLAEGPEGHAYVMGRNAEHARLAALLDALLQTEAHGAEVRDRVIAPLALRLQQTHAAQAGKAAATRVDFFTMVRGDD